MVATAADPTSKRRTPTMLVGCAIAPAVLGVCVCISLVAVGSVGAGHIAVEEVLEPQLVDEPFVRRELGQIVDLIALPDVDAHEASDGQTYVFDAVGSRGRARIECVVDERESGNLRIVRATLFTRRGEELPLLGVGARWYRPFEQRRVSLWPVTAEPPTGEKLPAYLVGTWRQVDLIGPIRVETTSTCEGTEHGATLCRNVGTLSGVQVGWESTFRWLPAAHAIEYTDRDLPDGETETYRMRFDPETRRARVDKASRSRTLETSYDLVSPDLIVTISYERHEGSPRRLHATGWILRERSE